MIGRAEPAPAAPSASEQASAQPHAAAARPSLTLVDVALAAAAGLAALALYLRTLAPTVLAFDSGEFQFVGPTLGLAHPTGYPLYLLLVWLTSFLPAGDVAHRVNLLSALCAAGSVGLTVPVGVTIFPGGALARRIGAVVAAALAAVAYEIWSQAVIAEVYALQLLLLATLLLAVVRRWPLPLIGLLVGLSLAHHRAALLSLPLLALYLVVDQRVSPAWLRRREVRVVAALAMLPLLLYLYIPLRADHSPYLYQQTGGGRQIVVFQNNLSGFVDEVTGRVFADKLQAPARLEERTALFFRLAGRQWNAAVLAVAAAGALVFVLRRPKEGLLVVGLFGVTVAFALLYRIGDIEVYFIPAYWAAALCAGAGVAVVVDLLRPPALATLVGVAAGGLLVVPPLLDNYPALDRSGQTHIRARWEQILAEPIERGAILASDDRDDMTPLWYFGLVEGVRPDLVGLFPGIVDRTEYADLGRLIDGFLGADEHIYLIKDLPGLGVKYRIEPAGSLWRVAGPAVDRDPPVAIGAPVGDSLRLDGAEFPAQAAGGTLPVLLWWSATQPPSENLTTFVHLIDHTGALVAQNDAPPGGLVYPTGRWRAGERLLDRHLLRLPGDLPAGRYRLRAGAYGADLARLRTPGGDAVDLGTIRVVRPPAGAPARLVGADFAGVGRLDGITVDGATVRLYWTAVGPTLAPLTVFLHLVDQAGRIVAQADGPPAGGALPTDSWLAGEQILDERRLALAGLPSGDYRLLAGLYDPATGRRVPTGATDAADLGILRIP
ncbi:MAG: DUF2723 domain-containing protein [Dehalococcoidia bacterium]